MRLWKGRRSGQLTFEIFGVHVGLEISDPDLQSAVTDILPAGCQLSRGQEASRRFGLTRSSAGGYQLTADGEPGLEYATLEVALGVLETNIEQFIAYKAHDWLFVHAGVVAQNGRALLVPGESFSGKSTIVAALVEAGAMYYSDEFAVFDRDGRVHPYPRRLSLRTLNGDPGRQLHARELGAAAAEGSAGVRVVAFARYRPGAAWQPRELTAAQAVTALFGSTLEAGGRPAEAMRTLRLACSRAVALEGERGEAGPTAAALLDLLGGSDER